MPIETGMCSADLQSASVVLHSRLKPFAAGICTLGRCHLQPASVSPAKAICSQQFCIPCSGHLQLASAAPAQVICSRHVQPRHMSFAAGMCNDCLGRYLYTWLMPIETGICSSDLPVEPFAAVICTPSLCHLQPACATTAPSICSWHVHPGSCHLQPACASPAQAICSQHLHF